MCEYENHETQAECLGLTALIEQREFDIEQLLSKVPNITVDLEKIRLLITGIDADMPGNDRGKGVLIRSLALYGELLTVFAARERLQQLRESVRR